MPRFRRRKKYKSRSKITHFDFEKANKLSRFYSIGSMALTRRGLIGGFNKKNVR